jgi:hypothetical protein
LLSRSLSFALEYLTSFSNFGCGICREDLATVYYRCANPYKFEP